MFINNLSLDMLKGIFTMKRNIITLEVVNNIIVYDKDTNTYLAIHPYKLPIRAYYRNDNNEYTPCIIEQEILTNIFNIVINKGLTKISMKASIDRLYPYKPGNKVKGYKRGKYFIITEEINVDIR